MLLEALSALVLASAAQAEAPPAAATRPPLRDLVLAMRSHCPAMVPRIQSASPDELLRLETGFRAQLAPADRSELDRAQARHGGAGRCGAGGGASCQANAGLSAILDSGQMGAFALHVCAQEAATAPR